MSQSNSINNRKRKADVLGRIETSSRLGRGALSGWTTCPLCPAKRLKKYALGRGISAHLWAVHTPWKKKNAVKKNNKKKIKKSKKRHKKNNAEECGENDITIATDDIDDYESSSWEPTKEEEEKWAERVAEIAARLEKEHQAKPTVGMDRTGKPTKSYRASIPPFLRAAADGDIETLQHMINAAKQEKSNNVLDLLDTRDRNGSTSEHWASGGGHLDCLKLLLNERDKNTIQKINDDDDDEATTSDSQKQLKKVTATTNTKKKKFGRRDGKTCLHYAARNGQLSCIRYLIEERKEPIDIPSGDGTTPLHLACYNGSPTVVQYLIDKGANVHTVNSWSCGASHWIAMTISKRDTEVLSLCKILHNHGVSFVRKQKQGHTALHKAAQKGNQHVIRWMAMPNSTGGLGLSRHEKKMASEPDEGGHMPSHIWSSLYSDDGKFVQWIKDTFECEHHLDSLNTDDTKDVCIEIPSS